MRQLIRRMNREGWRIRQERFALNDEGYGKALYVVSTPKRHYSLVCFSHHLEPKRRTDRVIAEAWDATFTLFDGVPTDADIDRLAKQTPKQEAGRFQASDLVMSRANKSLRLFSHVVDSLAQGGQPDPRTGHHHRRGLLLSAEVCQLCVEDRRFPLEDKI